MREVTLAEMLEARDSRAEAQRRLLAQTGSPLLSFTMNIPGPVKDSMLIRRGFDAGLDTLKGALAAAGIALLSPAEKRAATGCEFLCAVDANAEIVKALCLEIEDTSPMGRLFDMDVIGLDGQKLSRAEERPCLVCGAAGRGCASRRAHSLEELNAAVTGMLRDGLLESDAARIGALATKALLDEVDTTPKPGLVDRNNNGSHTDMTRETFYTSAQALRDYWPDCFRIGAETAHEPPETAFAALRARGVEAEKSMLAATVGVNTHKGAIFTLGAVCGAIGRLWQPSAPCRGPERIAQECAALCTQAVEADFAMVEAQGLPHSAGERLFLQTGQRGVRGELAEGLPAVLHTGLPALEAGLADGLSRNDAGVYALLYLIARGEDSNMVKRGGLTLARETASALRRRLRQEPRPSLTEVEDLDRRFIRYGLSPGGCADLLAVSFFLHDWKQTEKVQDFT